MIFSDDPAQPSFYIPFIASLLAIISLLYSMKSLLNYKKSTEVKEPSEHVQLQDTLDPDQKYLPSINERKNSLRFRYLVAYVLTRGSIWSKTAYMYTLYSTVHKFSMAEMGVLYIVDALSALIFGPITGNLADIFGRKMFCMSYCVIVVSNLSLRMTGSRPLAYVAQVLTGIGNGLITCTFESWANYEAAREFKECHEDNDQAEKAKRRFLKRIFKSQVLCDAMMSVGVTFITSILFTLYGLYAPLFLSMTFAVLGFIYMGLYWDENNPNKENKNHISTSYKSALEELKKREVLLVGIIESLFAGAMHLYLFAWTPILTKTNHDKPVHIGLVYNCYVLSLISGAMLYDFLVVQLRFGNFKSLTGLLFVETCCFMVIYISESFSVRLIFLSLINGCSGFFNPLNAVIKSLILEERLRALLMSLFRIPLNIYVITVFLFLSWLEPFQICLIGGGMTFSAFFVALALATSNQMRKEN